MRKLLFITFIGLAISIISSAQSKAVMRSLEMAHISFLEGIQNEHFHYIDDLLDKDVTLGFPDGDFTPKSAFVDALKSGGLFYDSAANESFRVRVYGNTGIVNGKCDLVFRYKDEKGEWYKMLEHLTYTCVYVIDKKKIKMVAWQSNRPTTDIAVKLAKQ